jgi:preprotein translocase subunit SecB
MSDENMPAMPINIHAQYVRDLSFENPDAPNSLERPKQAPSMDVGINVDVRNLQDGQENPVYEVILKVSANATNEGRPMFVADVEYAAAVSLDNVPTEHHHPLLLIEVPKLLFPFARQILSDMTTNGGFPPVFLNPVDFHALYIERFAQQQDAS